MSKIPEHILKEIQQRCDIVELVSGYIPIKKAGRNFKACCPFHHEKTPSFMVSQDKQIFHCFGCGVGGDIFAFIMRYERLEFPEAVKMLASKTGIEVPQDTDSNQNAEKSSLTKLLYKINELATWYFENCLKNGKDSQRAVNYLVERKLSAESIQKFQIGYADEQWNGLLQFLRSKGANDSVLLKSGLIIRNDQGRLYDRFRGRIIFPIFNGQGKIIAFGGRILEEKDARQAKYINSPETEIYQKGKNVYGFNFSKLLVSKHDFCIVVEGYLDFIVPFQFGVQNLVASLGTAFTQEQARLLKRYTNNIVIVFDSDDAGQEAALRSLDLLLDEGISVKISVLPQGSDPDSFVLNNGAEAFNQLIIGAKSLFDFKLDYLAEKFNKNVPEDKARIAHEMLLTIRRVRNAVARASYIKNLSEALNVSEDAIVSEIRKIKTFSDNNRQPASEPIAGIQKVAYLAEKMLLSILFEDDELLLEAKQKIQYTEFQDVAVKNVVRHLYQVQGPVGAAALMNRIDDPQVNLFLSKLLVTDFGVEDRKKSFEDCLKKIKKDGIQLKIKTVQGKITKATNADEDQLHSLYQEFYSLKKELSLYEKSYQEKS